jgi:hypothetical protein
MDYYYADGDQQHGPVSIEDLRALKLPPDTLAWREGLPDWVPIRSIPELASSSTISAGLRAASIEPGTIEPQMGAFEPQSSTFEPTTNADAPLSSNSPPSPLVAAVPVPAIGPYAPTSDQYAPSPGAIGYHTYAPTGNPNNGMAVASLVLGIISFPTMCLYLVGVITAILAIVFGMIARGKVRRRETDAGAGLALAGIICGACALGMLVVFILIALAFAFSM